MQNITFNVANTAMLSYDNLHVHFRASSSLSLNYYHYMIAYIKNQYLSFLFEPYEFKQCKNCKRCEHKMEKLDVKDYPANFK